MKHDNNQGDSGELAALYAAGAMNPDQIAWFELHLEAGCEQCLAEVRRFYDVLSALATAIPPVTPNPQTRINLLKRIKAESPSESDDLPLIEPEPEGKTPPEIFFRKAHEGGWKEMAIPGVQSRVLHVDRASNRVTALVRMQAGASFPGHVHAGPEEVLVLEGELIVGEEVLQPGDYQYAPAGSWHEIQHTIQGCLVLVSSSLFDTNCQAHNS